MKTLLLLGACATAIAAKPAKPDRVKLPMDWAVGSEHRYRAIWTRSIDVWKGPGSPPPAMNTEQRGQIAIRVTGKSKEGYRIQWEPTVTTTYPPPAKGDGEAAGVELWRFGLTLPLDLHVPVDGGPLEVRNAREARERKASKFTELMRAVGMESDLDCVGRDASTVACRTVGTEAATSALLLRSAAPLFNCSGFDVSVREVETWSEPHPSPEIGEALMIEHRRSVVGYDARSPRIRLQTVTEPSATQLEAWIKEELAGLSPADKEKVDQVIAQLSYRFETDCTVDRKTGWPTLVEFKGTVSAALYQGSETVRFERIEP